MGSGTCIKQRKKRWKKRPLLALGRSAISFYINLCCSILTTHLYIYMASKADRQADWSLLSKADSLFRLFSPLTSEISRERPSTVLHCTVYTRNEHKHTHTSSSKAFQIKSAFPFLLNCIYKLFIYINI